MAVGCVFCVLIRFRSVSFLAYLRFVVRITSEPWLTCCACFVLSCRCVGGYCQSRAPLQTLQLLDSRHNFTRMSTRFTGDQMAALGRAVLRRVEVVPQPFGGYMLQPNDRETDHGEGGEPLPPPPPPPPADSGVATGAGAGAGAGDDVVEDSAETQAAATKLQAIHRGNAARRRVDGMKAEQ